MPLSAITRTVSSLEALRLAVDELDHQVTVLGPDGGVVHVNARRRAWLAEDPARPDLVRDHAPFHADDAADPAALTVAAGIREVLAGARDVFEGEYRCRDRWFALRATSMAVDGVGAILVRTDVTDRHLDDPGVVAVTAGRAVSRRALARRLDGLLAAGPVGLVSIRPRRTGPRSLRRLGPGAVDVVRRTAELVARVLPADAVVGRAGPDHVVVLLPGLDEDALGRTAVPLAAGWRARIGRPHDLEATIETVLALPGQSADALLAGLSGELTLHAAAAPAEPPAATAADELVPG